MKKISSLDQGILMSDSDPIKKMFKQHKNINAYTKWFNTIPLLGTTALGANAYFNNNKDE